MHAFNVTQHRDVLGNLIYDTSNPYANTLRDRSNGVTNDRGSKTPIDEIIETHNFQSTSPETIMREVVTREESWHQNAFRNSDQSEDVAVIITGKNASFVFESEPLEKQVETYTRSINTFSAPPGASTPGNDIIYPSGYTTIDGGRGLDTLVLDLNGSDVVWTTTNHLTILNSLDGAYSFTLYNVELLQLNDQTITLIEPITPMLEDYSVGINGWLAVGFDTVYDTVAGPHAEKHLEFEIRNTSGENSVWLDGVGLVDASNGYTFDAELIESLWVQGSNSTGVHTLNIRAWDGFRWSAWDDFNITTRASNSQPVITYDNITLDPEAWKQIDLGLAYSDADGDSAYRFEIWDSEGNNSFWVRFEGYAYASDGYILTREQLDHLWVQGADTGGNQTLWIRAHDGVEWSAWDSFVLTTLGAEIPPVATIDNLTLTSNTSVNVSDISFYSDGNNDAATQYEVWDDEGADSFILNGTAVDAEAGYTLSAADLDNLQLHGDSSGSTQTLWIRANDGSGWSAWDSFVLTTADSQLAIEDGLII
ncbi:hypothetical protein [Cochlodiniinecator piscidefendens]|uniref:hypothetical protein n=1 Tax=Cochlodiniinecator piscidefendens TaxID=2715756 RepID=UPI0014088D2F|nr:hypothetical protein [Cochlodiniinecator piscidefendens]